MFSSLDSDNVNTIMAYGVASDGKNVYFSDIYLGLAALYLNTPLRLVLSCKNNNFYSE
jgi:hypothetical protein